MAVPTSSTCRRTLGLLTVLLFVSIISFSYRDLKWQFFVPQSATASNNEILVLAWTRFQVGKSDVGIPWELMDPPLFQNCPPELNCRLTSDRSLLNVSRAVLFHATFLNWDDLPVSDHRLSNQYYVFAQWEPPENTITDLSRMKTFFNLTMTYRRDSDIFWPYGRFRRRSKPELIDFDQLRSIVENKTKLAAWFVSDCQTPSGREKFVDDLQTHLRVDIYGKCGTLECSSEEQPKSALGSKRPTFCDKMLSRDYKFYLALENSLCKDYVTEKFFERLANAVLIPIILERKLLMDSIDDPQIAEAVNQSFIAVDDFENVQNLAEYLQYLHKNMTAYLEYFEWRRQYEVVFEAELKPGCELCRLIRDGRRSKIEDIGAWWRTDARCHVYATEKEKEAS